MDTEELVLVRTEPQEIVKKKAPLRERLEELKLKSSVRPPEVRARAGNGLVRLRTLSLGWGVQSWFLAAASARGEYGLEQLDYAFHADTTFEHEETYAFAKKWTGYLTDRGIKVETVTERTATSLVLNRGNTSTFMPAYTKDNETGEGGKLNRACTERWKIRPIRKRLNEILVSPEVHSGRKDNRIEQWLGISYDEWYRAKNSSVRYITSRHPLIELKLTRQDCINKLLEWFGPAGLPPKSSCVQCPFHGPKTWHDLVAAGGKDLADAIEVDEAIRHKRPGYTVFVHPKLIPLKEFAVQPRQSGMVFDDDGDKTTGECFEDSCLNDGEVDI